VNPPADLLASLVASDGTRPRLTFYDDAPGPTHGERIELSARVLANWVAKAANLLQDDLDGAPATTVGLDLPAHWRGVYWALAAWSVGATVVLGPGARTADVVVTTQAAVAEQVTQDAGLAVLVTLPMLARGNPGTPADVVDEARDLAGHGDVFTPWEEPDGDDPALVADGATTAYDRLVAPMPAWGAAPRVRVPDRLGEALTTALSAWAADGSVVLVREPGPDQSARLASEGVTVDLA
jgi:uncharacterized protein (TIGR03089 family)